jgi:hypothetical protein
MALWTFAGAAALLAASSGAARAGTQVSAGVAALQRNADGPDADAKGRVSIRSRAGLDQEELQVEAERLDALGEGESYQVFLDDGSGVLASIGVLDFEAGSGKAELEIETADGDALPFGAGGVADLIGRAIEVRRVGNDAAPTILFGIVPSFAVKGGASRKGAALLTRPLEDAPDEDARGSIQTQRGAGSGGERFRVLAAKVGGPAAYDVGVELVNGVWTTVGSIDVAAGKNQGSFEANTARGDVLPGDADTVDELAGLRLRVADGEGRVVLEGVIPERLAGGATAQKARADLAVAAGRIEWLFQPKTGRSRFRVSVRGLDAPPGTELTLFMRASSLDAFEAVAARGSIGTGVIFDFDQKQGAPLPLGAASAPELSGAEIEVRDAGGQVLASGAAP